MSRWGRPTASTLCLKEYILGATDVTLTEGSAVSFKNIIIRVCLGVWREVLIGSFSALEVMHSRHGLLVGEASAFSSAKFK